MHIGRWQACDRHRGQYRWPLLWSADCPRKRWTRAPKWLDGGNSRKTPRPTKDEQRRGHRYFGPPGYGTAGETAGDLRRFLNGEPILAKLPTVAQHAVKWCFRHRRTVAAAVSLLVLAVVALSVSTVLIVRSRNDAVAAQKLAEDRDRENRRMLSAIETRLQP